MDKKDKKQHFNPFYLPGRMTRIGDPHATGTRPAMLCYSIPLRPKLTGLVVKLRCPLSFEEHFFSLSLTYFLVLIVTKMDDLYE